MPRILVFVRYYLPGYKSGGPVRSIANLVAKLSDQFEFLVVTKDRDTKDAKPYPGIKVDAWNDIDGTNVYYLSPEQQNYSGIRRVLDNTDFDVLYLNSFWDVTFSIYPLVNSWLTRSKAKSTILAPRGEFSKGALTIKPMRKEVYLMFSKLIGLHKGILWQASSEFEKTDILKKKNIYPHTVIIAPNFAARIVALANARKQRGDYLNIVFLSRISKKKNLHSAIDMLNKCKKNIRMTVYGPIDSDNYWRVCQKKINKLQLKFPNISVEYRGSVSNDKVNQVLSQYDLFFLPTLGENFGHVIFEALAAGLPVLISDQTPWKDLEENEVGWSLPLDDSDRFAQKIDEIAEWDDEKATEVGRKAREYAIRYSNEMSSLEQNGALFQRALRPKK